MKTLQQIKADLDEANKKKGPERLLAVRGVFKDPQAFERHLADDPNFGTYDMVQEMRGVIGEVENTMNRLESAQRRTV